MDVPMMLPRKDLKFRSFESMHADGQWQNTVQACVGVFPIIAGAGLVLDRMMTEMEGRLVAHLAQYESVAASYVWDFVRENLAAAVYVLLKLGMLNVGWVDEACMLVPPAAVGGPWTEVTPETGKQLQGTYLNYDTEKAAWIRTGKVAGVKRGVLERHKEHDKQLKRLDLPYNESRYYTHYAWMGGDAKSPYEKLKCYAGVTWQLEQTKALQEEFHWSAKTIQSLRNSKAYGKNSGAFTSRKQHMVAFLFELVLDLSLDPAQRMSGAPGFESFCGWRGGKHADDATTK